MDIVRKRNGYSQYSGICNGRAADRLFLQGVSGIGTSDDGVRADLSVISSGSGRAFILDRWDRRGFSGSDGAVACVWQEKRSGAWLPAKTAGAVLCGRDASAGGGRGLCIGKDGHVVGRCEFLGDRCQEPVLSGRLCREVWQCGAGVWRLSAGCAAVQMVVFAL